MKIPFEQFFYDEVSQANAFLTQLGYRENKATSTWAAAVSYENEEMEIEYSFGDKDLMFNTRTKFKGHGNKEYGLWEWVDALGASNERKITGNLVSDEAKLGELIQNSALCLQENLSQILKAETKVLDKIEKAREKVRLEWEAKYK